MTKRSLGKIALFVLLAAVVVGIWFSPLREHLTRDNIRAAVQQARGAWYAPIIFIFVYAAGCVVALPASVFVIAAGFVWGWLLGGIYSLIGGMIGACASFVMGRFIGAGLLDRFGTIGRAVTKQLDHAGFKSLLIIRNVPGIPFAVLNYGAGVAGARFRDFFWSTLLGIVPSMFVFTYCADALFNGSMTEGDAFKRLLVVCGLMLTMILLPVLVRRLTSKRGRKTDEPGSAVIDVVAK
ncbi:MAG TPA: TVP38/TMEM64 family protein [Thermoanaerobaculia bacterium]|nr:TVP38/TMEM64 family protein [Thermoanaerobaculia bacterium]